MTFSADIALAGPELVLAVAALVLLVFGAFAPRATTAMTIGSTAALAIAAYFAAFGTQGRGFAGGLVADDASAFSQVALALRRRPYSGSPKILNSTPRLRCSPLSP